MFPTLRAALRHLRTWQARTLAVLVSTAPGFEPLFVAAGRCAAAHSRLLGGLYWHAHSHLIVRLRQSGHRYRPLVVCGVPLDLDVTDTTGRLHYFHDEPYEPAVTAAIAAALSPGDVFLDVGANVGFFAVFAARLVGPSGRVIAFEPHPVARDELATLAARNGVADGIDVVAVALSEREGTAPLHLDDEFTSYATLDPAASPMRASAVFGRSIPVATMTLDRWLADRADLAPRIRCIKIDVEGAEARVLAGMADLLSRYRGPIICETSLGSPADVLLCGGGFTRRAIEPGVYGNHLYIRS